MYPLNLHWHFSESKELDSKLREIGKKNLARGGVEEIKRRRRGQLLDQQFWAEWLKGEINGGGEWLRSRRRVVAATLEARCGCGLGVDRRLRRRSRAVAAASELTGRTKLGRRRRPGRAGDNFRWRWRPDRKGDNLVCDRGVLARHKEMLTVGSELSGDLRQR